MKIVIEGWDPVDRQPVRGELAGVDRAQTQAADLVTVVLTTGAAAAGGAAGDDDDASGDGNASSSGGGGKAGGGGRELAVVMKQNPTLLQRTRPGEVRVGACVWDSGYVLCALLEALARRRALDLAGARCVELGAGCALVGLVAARLGASVMLTGAAGGGEVCVCGAGEGVGRGGRGGWRR